MANDGDRINPSSDPELKGDLPDEIDLWFADEIEYEDLSEEGQRKIDLITKRK